MRIHLKSLERVFKNNCASQANLAGIVLFNGKNS
jgi:hypothetical protein